MLPDRKMWCEQFIHTEHYKNICNQIDTFPVPNIESYWEGWEEPRYDIPRRLYMYLRRIVSLCSFYPIDYINKVTEGQEIINVCYKQNFFANMYNICTPNGTRTFNHLNPIGHNRLAEFYKKQFKNAFSICEYYDTKLFNLDLVIKDFIGMIEDGGYGYFAINVMQMFGGLDEKYVTKHELNKYYRVIMFIDNIFEQATRNVDVLYYENILESLEHHNTVDGTIRLFFKTRI